MVRVPLGLRWDGIQEHQKLPGEVPSGQLGLHLLHLLAESDPAIAHALASTARTLPPCGLTAHCPAWKRSVRSLQPLYRSAYGGVIHSAEPASFLPFDGVGSGGQAPVLDPAVAQRLAELGYGGR